MAIPVLTIGDDFDNSATLKVDGSAYDVSSATSVKAVVTNQDSDTAYCDVVTLNAGATGADFANGVIVFNFTAAVTADIGDHVTEPEIGLIETQVETSSGKKYTWTAPVKIRPGNID